LQQKKTKVFGFVGADHLSTKIIINDETLEQVSHFTYLGCSISYQFSSDVKSKLSKCLQLVGTIKRTIFRKVRTETMLKIYNTSVLPTYIFMWARKLDSNSLTKTKNWNGRNEVIETSGRLNPLWPQDKWIRKPQTTYYRHTRQDRWIQTELVSTLAKNAPKPNPFEIILLQTTRKENNWKTEETLEREQL